jgi:ribosome-binding factor A
VAREFSRTRRVGEQIQRELAQLIQQELKDPRLGMVTVSAVEVSRDLAYAKVYISTLNPEEDIEQTLKVLRRAGGFLRRELGRRMLLRIVPELRFVYDESIERGSRLNSLIEEAVSKDRKKSDTED